MLREKLVSQLRKKLIEKLGIADDTFYEFGFNMQWRSKFKAESEFGGPGE